jgi:hypothetical protein
MSDPRDRFVQVIHVVGGRARFRLPWLRRHPEEVNRLADLLAQEKGMLEVEIRAHTGSVLCRFDPARLDSATLLQRVAQHAGVEAVIEQGQPVPVSIPDRGGQKAEVARELAGAFQELDASVRRATEGALDLGTLVTMGFAAAGALQVAVKGRIPAPPWFTLGWWGIRTFITFERDATAKAEPAARST